MTKEDMQKFILPLLFILLPFQLHAADYDAFILNFLRVTPTQHNIQIDLSLGAPQNTTLQKYLEKGRVIKLRLTSSLYRSRLISDKEEHISIKDYYFSYDPLIRQCMLMENQDILLRNSDAEYLLKTLLNSLSYNIETLLQENKHYRIVLDVEMQEAIEKSWVQKNLFFLGLDIIQPSRFEYEFDF